MTICLEFLIVFVILLGIDFTNRRLNLFGIIFWSLVALTLGCIIAYLVWYNWDIIVEFTLKVATYGVVGFLILCGAIGHLSSGNEVSDFDDKLNYYKVEYRTKTGFNDTTIITSTTELNSYDVKNRIPDCEIVHCLTKIRSMR